MMQHATEDDLVLCFYRELGGSPDVEAHIFSCPECLQRLKETQTALQAVQLSEPELASNYEGEVWNNLIRHLNLSQLEKPSNRISSRQLPRSIRDWLSAKRLTAAVACLALLVLVFLAGRHSSQVKLETVVAAKNPVRDRILAVAVKGHLERSRMVIADLVNARSAASIDISSERETAEYLLEANRLYRQTAAAAGDTDITNVLDILERILLEVAHSPASVSAAQLQQIRARVEEQGLIFKLRITEPGSADKAILPQAKPLSQL